MWVMNQDEDQCIECAYLGVYDNQIVAGAGDKNGLIVGEYKTSKRAKEIVKSFMIDIHNGKTTFWMPKE